ncbi:PREDICTED: cysteine-rich repeat secretory protein 58-like [Camelina sativa]|uniref:Cysteine-rich repeat secretory protein 58-like n=1 Tax=Camelina sativa TaxID=90675 RepID=A0ABM0U6W2_CAMSA|nr:PREDICTED: cysteine-rich repeat secretory protein 58-like [Camelina sativa]
METAKKLSALFCFSSLFCLFFTINQAVSESEHMETFCNKPSRNTTSNNTTYDTNLNTLLSTLSNQSSFANYYNLTTGLASDTVHGMFLCIGDVNRTSCNACVKNATIEIAKNSLTPYYYMDVTRFDGSYDLGSLVQCSPHLDPEKCTV